MKASTCKRIESLSKISDSIAFFPRVNVWTRLIQVRPFYLFYSGLMSSRGSLGVWCGGNPLFQRRHCATSHGRPADEQRIIDACNWKSEELLQRLGIQQDEALSEEKLKRHFQVLAKYYHPDTAENSADAAEAFGKIKEAYDEVLKNVKDHGPYAQGETPRFVYADEARRRAQMRVMGDGVIFFGIFTLLYIFLVARHNKRRVSSYKLQYFVLMFFIIQLFPRILSAAILFAWMSESLVDNEELRQKAALTVLAEKEKENVRIKLEGIQDADKADIKASLSIITTTTAPANTVDSKADSSDAKVKTTDVTSQTLEIDPGVISFTVPAKKLTKVSNAANTSVEYQLKVENIKNKFILCDKPISLDF